MIVPVHKNKILEIGHIGDNEAIVLAFPVQKMIDDCGEGGTFTVLYLKPGDALASQITTDINLDNGVLYVHITEGMLDTEGYGCIQINYVDDATMCGEIYDTHIITHLEEAT